MHSLTQQEHIEVRADALGKHKHIATDKQVVWLREGLPRAAPKRRPGGSGVVIGIARSHTWQRIVFHRFEDPTSQRLPVDPHVEHGVASGTGRACLEAVVGMKWALASSWPSHGASVWKCIG